MNAYIATKTIEVLHAELQPNDVVLAVRPIGNVDFTPVKGNVIVAVGLSVTPTKERVPTTAGVNKAWPTDTMYKVRRELTAAEQHAKDVEMAQHFVTKARDEIASAQQQITDQLTELAAKLVSERSVKQFTTWQIEKAVHAEAELTCWAACQRVLDNRVLGTPTDEDIIAAVLTMVEETERDLMRSFNGSSRSTNPYSNAVEQDERAGQANWLRSHVVLGVKMAADILGVSIEKNDR